MDRETQEIQNTQTGVADCNQAIATTGNEFCSGVGRILDADDIDVQLQTAFSPEQCKRIKDLSYLPLNNPEITQSLTKFSDIGNTFTENFVRYLEKPQVRLYSNNFPPSVLAEKISNISQLLCFLESKTMYCCGVKFTFTISTLVARIRGFVV